MLFDWFDSSEAEKFGVSLAQQFIDGIPPSQKKNRRLDKKFAAVDRIYKRIEEYKRSHKLNFYKKAKLWNAFKWHLISAGYEKEFVDQMTQGLMPKL
ncbi:MAG TPA: hypothetical protein PLK99_11045 [Burkholderiales bacterium]|nr:hypothetical protein [Burkholderiales bacterium]